MRRRLRPRQAARTTSRRKNDDDSSEESSSDSEALHTKNDNALKSNVTRRRSLRLRQSSDKSSGNEENSSEEITSGSDVLPNNSDVDENVLKGNVTRRSLRLRQSGDKSSGNEENRSEEITVDSGVLPNNSDVDENVLKDNIVRRKSLRVRRSLDKSYGNEENRSQETTVGSNFLPNYTDVDENMLKGNVERERSLRLRQSLDKSFVTEENRTQETTVSSNILPNNTAVDENVLKGLRPGWWRDLQDSPSIDAIPLYSSPILGDTRYDFAENPPHGWHQHLDRTEIPSFRRTSDVMTRSSKTELYPSPDTASSSDLSKNVENHSVSRHDGIGEGGQSSPASLSNTNLRIVGHRPFTQKRNRKSSLYKNLNFALEDDVESPQRDETHTKSASMHSSPLSESTNSPIKNSSKPLRKNKSVKLSNSEDFTKTYEDDTELVEVKDRYKNLRNLHHFDGIVPLSDVIDDNQKERSDKSELEGDQVINKDHEVSHNKRSPKSIGSSILLHTTESPVPSNLRPFKKSLKMVRDFQHFEEVLGDDNVTHRDKAGRSVHDELLLKSVASYEGSNTLEQISGTPQDLQSIDDEVTEGRFSSPTISGNVSPIEKMGYNPFARKKGRKSSVYRGLELVLEENSESSQTHTVPRKSTFVTSSVPSESSGSPSKEIFGSPSKKVSKMFQKNKSVIQLNERDLISAFEDISSDTVNRKKSKGVRTVDGDYNVASSMNRTVFENSLQSKVPSDTTGSPVQTNTRPFKKNTKITTDHQHVEKALDIDKSWASDKEESRKSQGTTGGRPSASGSSRESAMLVEQGSFKEMSYDTQSSVSNTSPAGKMSIKPLMRKKSRKSSYRDLELAVQEEPVSKITTDYQNSDEALDISDSRTSGRNKSRKSQETAGSAPLDSRTSREAAMLVEQNSFNEDSYDIQSSVSNASPAGKMGIKPLIRKKSRKSSIYKNLELVLQEKPVSKSTTASDSGTSREAAMPVEQNSFKEVSYDIQSSVSNASPAGKMSIKPLMGKKSRKSSYRDLELAVQEEPVSKITTDYQNSDEALDISDSRTSGRNKSRKSQETAGSAPLDSRTSREAAMLVEQNSFNEDSYDIQSSVSNASPAGKMSIKPLIRKKSRKSSIYKNLELVLQEKPVSKSTTASDSGTSREAAMPVEQNSFKEVSYDIQSSVSNASPAGKMSIKPLMGKKSRKSSYRDLELAVQEEPVSKITTDYQNSDEALDISDSRTSGRNKSRKSQETAGSAPLDSRTSREAAMLVEQNSFNEDSYDIQSSVSNASPAGKMGIKPLIRKKSRKSSIYKNLELVLQEKPVSKSTTASDSGTSREAAMPVEQNSFKEVSYDIQSSVSNASPAGKMSIKPLMGKKSRKSSYRDLELAVQEEPVSKITTDYQNSDEALDISDSRTSDRNKSRKSWETAGSGPSDSRTSRKAEMIVEQNSFKEVSYDIQSSVSNASPAGKMSIKPLMRKKSRKSSYKNLELAFLEKSISQSDETPRKSSSIHSSYSSECSKPSVKNVPNIFPKNKSVVLSGLSTAFEGVLQSSNTESSNTVEEIKSNKKESESFHIKELYSQLREGNQLEGNILENSRNAADSHKNQTVSERSISSNIPSNSAESPLQTILTPFQKNTKLDSGYQNLDEDLQDSDSSMFDRGKISRSTTSTQLEHHKNKSNITLEDSVPASSHKEVAGEMELSSTSLSNTSPIDKMRPRPFTQNKNRKSSVYGSLQLVLDGKAEYSHKSEVRRIDTSTRSSLPSESSGSPIKTISKPFQKTKSLLLSYEGDLETIFEDNSNSSDIVDSNGSEKVRSVDGNDTESSQDGLYNRQLRDNIVSQQTEDMDVKNVSSSMNHATFKKYVQSNIRSDTTGSPDRTIVRVLEKNSRITTEKPVIGMSTEAAMLAKQDTLTGQTEVSYDTQSSVSNTSPAGKIRTKPLMQKEGQKSFFFKNLELALHESLSSQTSEMPRKSASVQSSLLSESASSNNKHISNILQRGKSTTLSDFVGAVEEFSESSITQEGTKSNKKKSDSSQEKQYYSHLKEKNESWEDARNSAAFQKNQTVSANYVPSSVSPGTAESVIHTNLFQKNFKHGSSSQNFDKSLEDSHSGIFGRNKTRKSSPTEALRKRSVTFKGTDVQEHTLLRTSNLKELHTVSSHTEGADEIKSSPSLKHNSRIGKMMQQPFTQKGRKSSVYKSLELAPEQTPLPSETNEIPRKDTLLSSSVPSDSSGSSIILSNEDDLTAASEEGSYTDSDIKPFQDGQHDSQLSGNNKKKFSKHSEEIRAKNSRHSVTSSINPTVSDSLVQSNIPSENTGFPVADNQHFEGILDSGNSITSARNKSRKSDQIQQDFVRQEEMHNIQPTYSNASPARNIPLMQNNSRKSSKSLKFASSQSNLSSQYSESPNKKLAKPFHENKSVVISNEADFEALADDTTMINTSINANIEPSQDKQHSSHLRIMNENSPSLKQDKTYMNSEHQHSETSDDTMILSDEKSLPYRKNVKGSPSNAENTSKNSSHSKMPSRSQLLAKPSPNKKLAKSFHENKSVVISNEADFEAPPDDTTMINTSINANIEPSQDKQHSSHLRIMNENSPSLKQDKTYMNSEHQHSENSDDIMILSDEKSLPYRKNVKGNPSNAENTSKHSGHSKMPSRSQLLAKPSEEWEMTFSSNSEPVPVANSTAVVHSSAKKMKYTSTAISDTSDTSSLVERSSHTPSAKQRSFMQNNKTLETSPFMRNDKSHRQSNLSRGTNVKSRRAEINVEQQLYQDSSARKVGNNTDLHHSSGLVAVENDSANKDIGDDNISVNKSKGYQFEPSPVVRTNIKKSISRFRLSKQKKNEVGKPLIKRTSGSLSSKSVIFSDGTNNTDKDNVLPLIAKGHTNDVNHSLQKNQDLEKAKEMNQERMKKIEENLHKERKKPRTIQEYFAAMKNVNNQKPRKTPRSSDPDFLVNGKVYHAPPFKKPKRWVSEPLINIVLKHCEKKYGPITKRRKAEQFLGALCAEVSTAMRRSKNYSTSVENTKKILYKFDLIKNLHDFYCFIEDFLPYEFRIKAIPCLRAFGKRTGPPWIPGTNIFQELEFD